MRFSAQQIERFRRDGFLTVPGFYGADEVAALQAEVERFKREGLVRNVATDGDGATHSTTKANLSSSRCSTRATWSGRCRSTRRWWRPWAN